MLLLACSAVFHVLLPGRHLIPAVTAIVLLALLLAVPEGVLRGRRPPDQVAGAVGAGRPRVADVAIGLTYISLTRGLDGRLHVPRAAAVRALAPLGVSGPVQFTSETHGDLFDFLMGALGIFTLVVVGYLFLRPARRAGKLQRQGRDRIRELLAKHGERDSLGYFALRNDKSVIWSPTGKSCIGYRVLSGVMLASGDPLGDPEAWPGAIDAFLDEAARHAWVPAVIGLQRAGRRDLVPGGRADRAGARRRGHRQRGRLLAAGPVDAQRPADGDPGLPGTATWPRSAGSATSPGRRSTG